MFVRFALAWALLVWSLASAAAPAADAGDPVDFRWGAKIPLRDGVKLNATLYRPQEQKEPLPCIFTIDPYVAQGFHEPAKYFAGHGYVFVTVDARGRGNSAGEFTPLLQEAKDGHDVVEWLAAQDYCNGKVAMHGGSYLGYAQWATAKEFPPHLSSIVPVASPRPGVDFPLHNNITSPYVIQWLTLTSGRDVQFNLYVDRGFWDGQFGKWYLQHRPFREIDALVGNPSPILQTWLAHPHLDAFWDSHAPTAAQFARIDLPILTITGQYDADQLGALSYYRDHQAQATPQARARHYLIIGPWDHFGSQMPTAQYGGVRFGQAAAIDLQRLHRDWYDWTLKGAAPPEFLKNKVAYYMVGDGDGEWRYADSLTAVTAQPRALYLASANGRADDVLASGSLHAAPVRAAAPPDRFVYDPLDTRPFVSIRDAYRAGDHGLVDQSGLLDAAGRILVYHSEPFAEDTELAGFIKLSAWLALDRRDTDLSVFVYEINSDGRSMLLAFDVMRARYRKSLREPVLVQPGAIERYDFERFNFIARRVAKGSRLRLVVGPVNSRNMEKNYNAGGAVAEESAKDARAVTIKLYHDAAHPSALYLPIAQAPATAKP